MGELEAGKDSGLHNHGQYLTQMQPAIKDAVIAAAAAECRPVLVYADGRTNPHLYMHVHDTFYSSRRVAVSLCSPNSLSASGVFDVFHFGHARALEQAKQWWVIRFLPAATLQTSPVPAAVGTSLFS